MGSCLLMSATVHTKLPLMHRTLGVRSPATLLLHRVCLRAASTKVS